MDLTDLLGITGTRQDIFLRQGAPFSFTATVKDEADELVDLTGYSFAGSVRRGPQSTAALAEFSCALLDQSDPDTLGQARVYLTGEDTQPIPGAPGDIGAGMRHYYDIDMILPDESRQPFLYGFAYVRAKGDIA